MSKPATSEPSICLQTMTTCPCWTCRDGKAWFLWRDTCLGPQTQPGKQGSDPAGRGHLWDKCDVRARVCLCRCP